LGLFVFFGIQALLGNKDVKTTMVYTRLLNHGPKSVRSPIDKVEVGSYAASIRHHPSREKHERH
jgi:hypothetical protein